MDSGDFEVVVDDVMPTEGSGEARIMFEVADTLDPLVRLESDDDTTTKASGTSVDNDAVPTILLTTAAALHEDDS